ncbi:MAG TPA: rRNA maturation RNase YbeY [Opitutaceae bacterium]
MKRAGRALGVVTRHPGLRVDRPSVAAAVGVLDAHAGEFRGGCPPGELSIAFLTDADLAGLHGRFLGDNSSTDVITFGGDAAHGTAGEICVSADAAVRIAGRGARRLSAELTLYVVHGWLHLSGYDDRDPASRRAIRGAESRAMRLLSRSASVPRFGLA